MWGHTHSPCHPGIYRPKRPSEQRHIPSGKETAVGVWIQNSFEKPFDRQRSKFEKGSGVVKKA